MNVTLNPQYILKPDDGRAFLLTYDPIRAKEGEQYENVIHPIHAMILSFFNGDDINNSIDRASNYLQVSREKICNFVEKLYENKNPVRVKFGNKVLEFPPRTLIDSTEANRRTYLPEDFNYNELNISLGRHKTITDITLMVNNNCMTDCIYCYANRKKQKKQISVERIMELIDEAVSIGVRSFDIIGGDIFAYKHWKIIVKKLYESGFNTFVSTKVPIKEEDIKFLKDIKIQDIQISLDTLIPQNLCVIVNRSLDYVDNIRNTLNLLNAYEISTMIHTIICSKNCSIEDMKSLFSFINKKDHISVWRINYAKYSLYKSLEDFLDYRPNSVNMREIYQYLKSLNSDHIEIMAGGVNIPEIKKDRKAQAFLTNKRMLCTANYSHFFILPDGKVTICEQLYWNPNFIVGDASIQSISEIWDSDKAKKLYYLDKSLISRNSKCKACSIFDDCRQKMGGVCWRDIVAAYGQKNWDYPDPRCPKAPKQFYDVLI
jgi:radical SAM protein with 4Fe4S-binding SPASM domain